MILILTQISVTNNRTVKNRKKVKP